MPRCFLCLYFYLIKVPLAIVLHSTFESFDVPTSFRGSSTRNFNITFTFTGLFYHHHDRFWSPPTHKALSWYSLGVELLKNSRPKLQGSCQVSRKIFCYDLLDIRRKLENNQSAFMRDQALKYFSFIPLIWGKRSKSIQSCGMASSVANKQASGTKYRNVNTRFRDIFYKKQEKLVENFDKISAISSWDVFFGGTRIFFILQHIYNSLSASYSIKDKLGFPADMLLWFLFCSEKILVCINIITILHVNMIHLRCFY